MSIRLILGKRIKNQYYQRKSISKTLFLTTTDFVLTNYRLSPLPLLFQTQFLTSHLQLCSKPPASFSPSFMLPPPEITQIFPSNLPRPNLSQTPILPVILWEPTCLSIQRSRQTNCRSSLLPSLLQTHNRSPAAASPSSMILSPADQAALPQHSSNSSCYPNLKLHAAFLGNPKASPARLASWLASGAGRQSSDLHSASSPPYLIPQSHLQFCIKLPAEASPHSLSLLPGY